MAEYIDKSALYEKIAQLEEIARNRYLETPSSNPCCSRYMTQLNERTVFKHIIADFPSADVAPVRHGRWVKNVRGDYSIVCSECGYGFSTDGYAWLECNRRSDEREYCFQITDVKNYCPNCGCKMDLEDA